MPDYHTAYSSGMAALENYNAHTPFTNPASSSQTSPYGSPMNISPNFYNAGMGSPMNISPQAPSMLGTSSRAAGGTLRTSPNEPSRLRDEVDKIWGYETPRPEGVDPSVVNSVQSHTSNDIFHGIWIPDRSLGLS